MNPINQFDTFLLIKCIFRDFNLRLEDEYENKMNQKEYLKK